MAKRYRVDTIVVLVIGGLIGYAIASHHSDWRAARMRRKRARLPRRVRRRQRPNAGAGLPHRAQIKGPACGDGRSAA